VKLQLVIPLILIFSLKLIAQELENKNALFFPLNKTDSQILPQMFEYQLIDKDQIRIGNIVMDARKVSLKMKPIGKEKVIFTFEWPAGLLTGGELVIKDNSGKMIWKKNIIEQQATNNLITYQTTDIDLDTIKKIRMYPFFRFCVHSDDQLTKMYLCSKELYFKKEKNKNFIAARDSLREESYVEINGHAVSESGSIFLQSSRDPISLRSKLLSGATLELDTRLKLIDFKDLYLTTDQKIIIEASGTEPVIENLILTKKEDSWTAELNKDRPFLYVKGEGGIPMKQEFILGQNIRPEQLMIPYRKKPNLKTYYSKEMVELTTEPDVTLETHDKKTQIEKISDTEWRWTIDSLQKNKNRSYLTVTKDSRKFIAAHDIFRAQRNELNAFFLMYPIWFDIQYQYWLSQYFGLQVNYQNYLQKTSSEPLFSNISFDFKYRFQPGIHLIEPGHGLIASYQSFIFDSTPLTTFSIGGYLQYSIPKNWNTFADLFQVQVKAPLTSNNGSLTLQSAFSSEVTLKKIDQNWVWDMGLRIQNHQLLNAANTTTNLTRIGLLFGLGITY